jgi:hypothetical protein
LSQGGQLLTLALSAGNSKCSVAIYYTQVALAMKTTCEISGSHGGEYEN